MGYNSIRTEMEGNIMGYEIAKFTIDLSPPFIGYHDGSRWNGFGCPFFEYEQAERIVRWFSLYIGNAWYDSENDKFVFEDRAGSEPIRYEYKGTDITVDGKTVHVYPIGTYEWGWSIED